MPFPTGSPNCCTVGAAKLLRPGNREAGQASGCGFTTKIPWRLIGGLELTLGLGLVTLRSRLPLLVAVGFLLAATAYLAVRLAALVHGSCECWGPGLDDPMERFGDEGVREALRPAWHFVRNGGLVAAAAIALGWSISVTALAAGTVWFLVMIGTLAPVLRLRAAAS